MSEQISIDNFNINILRVYSLGCTICVKLLSTDEHRFAVVLGYYLNYDGYVTLESKFITKIEEQPDTNFLVDFLDLTYTVTKIG
jgi:hypothetical protein